MSAVWPDADLIGVTHGVASRWRRAPRDRVPSQQRGTSRPPPRVLETKASRCCFPLVKISTRGETLGARIQFRAHTFQQSVWTEETSGAVIAILEHKLMTECPTWSETFRRGPGAGLGEGADWAACAQRRAGHSGDGIRIFGRVLFQGTSVLAFVLLFSVYGMEAFLASCAILSFFFPFFFSPV